MSPARHRGLGRGLDAILSSSVAEQAPDTAAAGEGVLVELRPDAIAPNPEQPRHGFDEDELQALADSLRAHGMLQPIVVERADGRLRLLAGERRLRAARIAGLATVPAVIRPATESGRHALELALVENLQRSHLTPLEEAGAFARLADAFGMSHEAIAMRIGRSRAAVTNAVRLLSLSAPVQEALAAGTITAGHARALLGVRDEATQTALLARVTERELSVRDTERSVQERLSAPQRPAPAAGRRGRTGGAAPAPASPDDGAVARSLEAVLGTPVRIERGRGRGRGSGRLVIEFHDGDQLDALYRRLGGRPL